MHNVAEVARITWENLIELGPYFFLALFIGASIDLLYLDVVARRSFKRHGLLGVVVTTCLGAFSPFCSFTVIPLIRKLLRGGVPLSAVMSFWIASPAMDLPIFALTARALGLRMAVARLLGALTLAISAGVLVLMLERRGLLTDVLRPERVASSRESQPVAVGVGSGGSTLPLDESAAAATDQPACSTGACGSAAENEDEDDGAPWWPQAKASLRSKRNWRITARNIGRDTVSLGKWLLFACFFEGMISVYVPTKVVTSLLGGAGLIAIPLAVLISVPLYLNGIGAIPIVAGLLGKGMAPGAGVSFLLAGAITTIPAMVAVRSVVNNRVFALYLGFGVAGSITLGFIAQLLL